MLAARGVSLGLGKINLSELRQLPGDRAAFGKVRRSKDVTPAKPKLRVKKHVDKKTLWAACRAVAFGTTIIVVGMIMAVVGYFDKDLSTYEVYDEVLQRNVTKVNDLYRIQLKSFQYIGPVVMGIGSFLLIIACVITLESRDRHAQVIQDENTEYRRLSERRVTSSNTKTSILDGDATITHSGEGNEAPKRKESDNVNLTPRNSQNGSALVQNNGATRACTALSHTQKKNGDTANLGFSRSSEPIRESTVAEVHVPLRSKAPSQSLPNGRIHRLGRNPSGPAPMAEIDSLLDANLSSSSSSFFLIPDPFAV